MRTSFLTVISVVLFFMNGKAQTIGLKDLLAFHHSQDPQYIDSALSETKVWVSNAFDFADTKANYDWYRTEEGQFFKPDTKDRLSYRSQKNYKPAIVYITLVKKNFDKLISSLHRRDFEKENLLLDDSRIKMYRFTNDDVVIEVVEPFVPQKDSIFSYVFMVFDREDYNHGFRLE